jgi:tetratricopeptide (TPR) repeat protein
VIAENYLANKNYEKALEKAEAALQKDSKYQFAYITKHFALLALDRKTDALRNLEQLVQIIGQNSIWDTELEYLRAKLENRSVQIQQKPLEKQSVESKNPIQKMGNGIGNGKEPNLQSSNSSPLQILTKPQPRFTEYARKSGVSGVVQLQVTFSANGAITAIRFLNYLPFGLTEQAIEAARQIKFAPMVKNGVPVSVIKTVEYRFIIN